MPSNLISKYLVALSLIEFPYHIKTKLFLLFKDDLSILFKSKDEINNFLNTKNNLEPEENNFSVSDEFFTEKVFSKLNSFNSWARVDEILTTSASKNFFLISPFDDNYPKLLFEISDFPILFYAKGNLELLNSDCISIVGARKASSYASNIIKEFVPKLVMAQKTIVSGLAIGVDSMAHQVCLASKGKTIAVLGSGINVIYPNTNRNLYENIFNNNGLIISEFEYSYPALPQNFPARNRIVAGLSRDTIIVEAKIKSGTLITARLAMENNRNVFVVPNSIFDKNFEGSNELIKQGAYILTKFSDLNIFLPENKKTASNFSENEKNLLKFIDKQGIDFNTLINVSKYSITDLITLLEELQEKNAIYRDDFDNIFKA